MIIEEIPRVNQDKSHRAALYQKKIEISGTGITNAFQIPLTLISTNGISITTSGAASVYATNYSEEDVENDIAEWGLWDGESLFSNAITFLYIDNPSGDSTVVVSILGSV